MTLKVKLGEHKQKGGDPKNVMAVRAHESKHAID